MIQHIFVHSQKKVNIVSTVSGLSYICISYRRAKYHDISWYGMLLHSRKEMEITLTVNDLVVISDVVFRIIL